MICDHAQVAGSNPDFADLVRLPNRANGRDGPGAHGNADPLGHGDERRSAHRICLTNVDPNAKTHGDFDTDANADTDSTAHIAGRRPAGS